MSLSFSLFTQLKFGPHGTDLNPFPSIKSLFFLSDRRTTTEPSQKLQIPARTQGGPVTRFWPTVSQPALRNGTASAALGLCPVPLPPGIRQRKLAS